MKKYFIYCIILLNIPVICLAQNAADALLKAAEQKEKLLLEDEALLIYQSILKADNNNWKTLCAASFLCSRCGNRKKGNDQKVLFTFAKTLAEKAYQLNSKEAECSFVMGVAMGRMALVSSIKNKVAASRAIKFYADKAVALNPNHAYALHLLGRYNLEVSRLSSVEILACNQLLGGLPPGDVKSAIRCFEKCRSIDKNYITNLLDLAYAYEKNKEVAKAKTTIAELLAAPLRMTDDAALKAEGKRLLNKLKF
jgi:tetratricopeptide (TPR) repeat protein